MDQPSPIFGGAHRVPPEDTARLICVVTGALLLVRKFCEKQKPADGLKYRLAGVSGFPRRKLETRRRCLGNRCSIRAELPGDVRTPRRGNA